MRAGRGGGERNNSVMHTTAGIVMLLHCPHELRMWAGGPGPGQARIWAMAMAMVTVSAER